MTQIFHQLTRIRSTANFILTRPACPLTSLNMIIHGFAFWKFAKPVHGHHLQVLPAHGKPILSFTRTLKELRHITAFASTLQDYLLVDNETNALSNIEKE